MIGLSRASSYFHSSKHCGFNKIPTFGRFGFVFCLYHANQGQVLIAKFFSMYKEISLQIRRLNLDLDPFSQLRSPNDLPFFEPEKVTPLPSGTMRELTMILKELRVLTDKLKADEEDDSIENDWKFAAMVLDRLCLITFTGFTMLATAALLITAPHVIVT